MKFKFLKHILASSIFIICSFSATAGLMTFEIGDKFSDNGFSTINTSNLFANPYSALTAGYNTVLQSGDYVEFAQGNTTTYIRMTDNSLWDFNSAWFASAWNVSKSLTIEGLNINGDVVHTATSTVLRATASKIVVDFTNIHTLRFDFTGSNQLAWDDLQYNEESTSVPESTSVSEPSTLAIFALGMIGLASRRFKQN
jgi:hypothetical protein